jgi:hypothetical protein
VRRLAYGVLVNMLCLDELRKLIMKQPKLDVMAKLISIVSKGRNADTEDMVLAL